MYNLENKVAVITGAAMGNGYGIAQVMAEKGVITILTDISDMVHIKANELISAGLKADSYIMDVSNYDDVKKNIDIIYEKYGHIDILVNNAGIARLIDINNISEEIKNFHFNVNINGVWNCSKAVLPYMIKAEYGRIINMSSVTGPIVVDPGMLAYATTKAAVLGYTKALSMDVAKYNITVNAIMPGYILTPMVMHTATETDPDNPQRVIDGIAAGVPLGRLGKTEEIGYLASFLASDEAAYITGAQIVIDGGSTLPETSTVGR